MRESRTPGSVRGVPSNGHSYRDILAQDHEIARGGAAERRWAAPPRVLPMMG